MMNKSYNTGQPEWEQILHALSNGEEVNKDHLTKLSEEERLLISELETNGQFEKAISQLHKIDTDRDWLYVKSQINEVSEKGKTISLYSKWLRYAAAILLPIMVVGIYFLSKPGTETTTIAAGKKTEYGSKKATLILSDGSTVELGANKSINNLDGTQVFDDKTNALVYTDTKGTNTQPIYNTLIIPKGDEYKLVLADGSEVWVNADTRIRYQVNLNMTNTREIFLETGEAFFKVTRNIDKPFIVHHGDMKVQVLGTSFNVNAYTDHIQTTLTEGKVKVSLNNSKKTLELLPDQQANFNKLTKSLEKEEVEVFSYVAWKDGIFAFENETMENLMERIGRLYDYEIEFKDEHLKSLHYSGSTIKPQDVKKIINIIQRTSNLKLTLKERTIIVEKSTRN